MISVTFFLFTDTAPTEIYTLSLHDALPIFHRLWRVLRRVPEHRYDLYVLSDHGQAQCTPYARRSEEHTSELQSHSDLVCRLLLEKKKKKHNNNIKKQK